MILTITLNPAVDISYRLENFSLNTVNRVRKVSKTAGGKGLNVAKVLKQLGEEVGSAGFLGGSLGNFIRQQMSLLDIQDLFVGIEGDTRNCIAIIHEEQQTEILESGPVITKSESAKFLYKFHEYVQKVDIVTISGSLPEGLSEDFYRELIEISDCYETPVLLDTKGKLLAFTLSTNSKPFLIKPNEYELADLIGEKITGERQIIEALHLPLFTDVQWIVVTTGDKGAIVKHGEVIYQVHIPSVEVINPVGSGDSVIAGFAAGISRGLKSDELIKFGLTMGVLNAMEAKTGHINPKKVGWCMNQINVERIL